jgi:hypothetical protein
MVMVILEFSRSGQTLKVSLPWWMAEHAVRSFRQTDDTRAAVDA